MITRSVHGCRTAWLWLARACLPAVTQCSPATTFSPASPGSPVRRKLAAATGDPPSPSRACRRLPPLPRPLCREGTGKASADSTLTRNTQPPLPKFSLSFALWKSLVVCSVFAVFTVVYLSAHKQKNCIITGSTEEICLIKQACSVHSRLCSIFVLYICYLFTIGEDGLQCNRYTSNQSDVLVSMNKNHGMR